MTIDEPFFQNICLFLLATYYGEMGL